MSFCVEVKTEIMQADSRHSCCAAAQLYGMLLFGRSFTPRLIELGSEHEALLEYAANSLTEYGIAPEQIQRIRRVRGGILRMTDRAVIERLLFDFGYAGDEPSFRILRGNYLCDECISAFIAGCFLAGGNITDPQKSYHLEFATHKSGLLADLRDLLVGKKLEPGETARGYDKILYFKNSGQIEDMLTYMGAVNASLALMNAKIYKEIINSVNRRTNCETANIDKAINASASDRAAIETIFRLKGRDFLPDSLREIAELRLDNPELPLAELGELLKEPLSKSGVSHRLRRIREESRKLKEPSNKNETE